MTIQKMIIQSNSVIELKAKPQRECCWKDLLTTLVMACSEKAKSETETETEKR
jgi:hypothetical protein